jgi:hypothetical protein
MEKIGGTELLLIFFIIVPVIISFWKLFERAGKPGWAIFVPFYNIIIQLKIIRKPWWWVFLICIPYLGFIWQIWALNLFVKSYGKNEGFTIGCFLLPFIFFPILAFDKSSKYIYEANSLLDKICISK